MLPQSSNDRWKSLQEIGLVRLSANSCDLPLLPATILKRRGVSNDNNLINFVLLSAMVKVEEDSAANGTGALTRKPK